MDRLPECDGCGVPTVDWNDTNEATLGGIQAKSGNGEAVDLGGFTVDGLRYCTECWKAAPNEQPA